MKHQLGLCLILSMLVTPTTAQEVNCSNPQTQFELNECSHRDWEKADQELNTIWPKVRAEMKQRDSYQPQEYRVAAKSLLEGQRGWLQYRDGQCAAERAEVAGGTMAPMVSNFCLARMTRARTEELKQMISER